MDRWGNVEVALSAMTSDLLIACTALTRDDAIITGNRRHFDRVPGLTVHDLS